MHLENKRIRAPLWVILLILQCATLYFLVWLLFVVLIEKYITKPVTFFSFFQGLPFNHQFRKLRFTIIVTKQQIQILWVKCKPLPPRDGIANKRQKLNLWVKSALFYDRNAMQHWEAGFWHPADLKNELIIFWLCAVTRVKGLLL